MSEIVENIIEDSSKHITQDKKVYTFDEAIPLINNIYLELLKELNEKFKYHEDLTGSLIHDLKYINEKLEENKFQVIHIITDNFLFCLEQIIDHNSDYFIYQKEKIEKKNKVYKNKLPKIGNRTLLKKVLKECDPKLINRVFKDIMDMFQLLIVKDDFEFEFNDDYVDYVKNKYDENKNFSKMIMVFDNINNLLQSDLGAEQPERISKDKKKSSSKKSKSKGGNNFGLNADFMKNIENTKIAQLAKNISEKMNINDFPDLSDPSKLLSSFMNPGNDENGNNGGGIGNLLKFVVNEVEGAFKNGEMNEKDLVGEAQNLMGDFQNMSGFDPMSLLNNSDIDISQFANIFSGLNNNSSEK